jgi:hypothetical protein
MKTPETTEKTGYSDPLFLEVKPKWTDERLVTGDKMATRYHDRDRTLRIVNGLCVDIFFRANDIEHESFSEIPDFAKPVENYKLVATKPVDYRKPLDSPYRKRTYTLSKEIPAQSKSSQRAHDSKNGPQRPKGRRVRNRRRRN